MDEQRILNNLSFLRSSRLRPIGVVLALVSPKPVDAFPLRGILYFLALLLFFHLEPQSALTSTAIEIERPFQRQLAFTATIRCVFGFGA
jgi:hypothetical protein